MAPATVERKAADADTDDDGVVWKVANVTSL
jgi:hypothetical protein